MEDEKTRSPSRLRPSLLPVFSLVGGKGGVGKTTCAAIAAIRISATSKRTLIVTTDPASSLSDVFRMDVSGEPRAVRGVSGLFAANVEAARAFDRWLEPRKALVSAIALRGTYLDDQDVARLLQLSLPGIDEVIGLLEAARLAEGFDAVVVDTAPTGHTLRLLAAPALLGRVAALLDGLQSHHRAVVSALRGSYRADAADALIADLRREGASLAALLRDATTDVSWVTLPEPMALEETADAIAALGAEGIPVRRLIVNRVTAPPPDRCAWCQARRRFESRALMPVASRFDGMEIVTYPEVEREPTGLAGLRALAKRRQVWRGTLAAGPIATRIRATLDVPSSSRSVVSAFRRNETIRWLLFGGKGGVGKSTCAAATALKLAETRRVLLVSTDPAHSLGDVFGQRFDNMPRPAAGIATLHVREIDAAEEMNRLRQTYVEAVDEAFARIARATGGDRAAFRDLIDLAPPGVDEVIAIADIAEAVADGTGGYDVIVTDTAPTGHALRLLQTPAVLRDWTLALMALLVKYREIVGAGALAALLVRLSKRLRAVQDALQDPARTAFIVVTRPAALPSSESRALVAALERLGIAVSGIVVNAAGRGTCRRCRAIARAQAAEIARMPYAIIVAPAEVPPPHGAAALRAWIDGWRPPIS
jgi:arsenite/tail-anchored protein-transporting ATPase